MVAQLCQDFNSNYEEVNKQLDKMGYNIGMRLVEDFFAKSGTQRCANFRETAENISKVRIGEIMSGLGHQSSTALGSIDLQLQDWLQDILEYHADGHKLDGGQQAVLPDVRGESSYRLR